MLSRLIALSAITFAGLALVGCRAPTTIKAVIEKPEDVALIDNYPIHKAAIIGEVSSGDNVVLGARVTPEEIIIKLKEDAAAIGANALLMTSNSTTKIKGGKALKFWHEGRIYTVYVVEHDNVKTIKCMAAYLKPYPPLKKAHKCDADCKDKCGTACTDACGPDCEHKEAAKNSAPATETPAAETPATQP